MLYENYIEKPLPKNYPFTKNDIYKVWDKIISDFGCYNLNYPTITYDPKLKSGFSIDLSTCRIILNCYYIPRILPPEKLLWWLENFAIQHEIGHYHSCPYSSKNVIEYLNIVEKHWKASNDQVLSLLNFFYDLIVDYYVSYHVKDFKPARMIEFEWIILETQHNKMNNSYTMEFFIRIHELYWNIEHSLVKLRDEEEKIAKIIANKIKNYDKKTEILESVIILLQKYFDQDRKSKPKQIDEIQIPTQKEIKIMLEENELPTPEELMSNNNETQININDNEENVMHDDDADNNNIDDENSENEKEDEETEESEDNLEDDSEDINEENEDEETDDDLDYDMKDLDSLVPEIIPDKENTNIEFDGESLPLDQVLDSDPFDPKLLSNVSNYNKQLEKAEMIDTIINDDNTASIGYMLEKYNFASDVRDQARLILRYNASDLINYDITTQTHNFSVKSDLISWEWSNKMKDWDITKSINSNPIFPYPPFAKKWKYKYGSTGKAGVQYRDLLIGLDSSGSMCGISNKLITDGICTSKFDNALMCAFALLSSAIKKDVKLAGINFSDKSTATKWILPKDKKLIEIENILLESKAEGTKFPASKFEKAITQNPQCLVVIITDLEIANMYELYSFESMAQKMQIPVFILKIGSYNSNNNISDIYMEDFYGIRIVNIGSMEDLINLTLKISKKFYT